jgi:hypothetical protein
MSPSSGGPTTGLLEKRTGTPRLLNPTGSEGVPSGRLPGLDLVRATAIMLVVLQHGVDLLVRPAQW